MGRDRKNLEIQAEDHPLVDQGVVTLQRHCLALVHLKAYETAAEMAAGKDALDIGCNHGYGTALMAAKAKTAVGVDVSAASVAAARKRQPGVRFEQVDGVRLPFPDGSFDLVVFFQVIEHLDDPVVFLTEVKRVLRRGGRAMLTTPNRAIRIEPGGKPWNRFHVKEYVAADLGEELRRVFDDVVVQGLHAPDEFERIEFDRVAEARKIHGLREGGRLHRMRRKLTKKTRRAKAKLLEGTLRLPLVAAIQRRRFAKWTTAALRYTAEKPETALDLMAVCTKR